ncbi:GNAT family N-acetyltransferase [Oceaniglobus ichthyenteri]|uniref:GNAT family N-acetyltransferase n=1 Tax=Oceaniglobus ichthyenteri TaxID=2136177 RepID=UPI000D35D2F9|nr:GNAT family N-acetyltransferase [Oceaniglobus ichthyenteri]
MKMETIPEQVVIAAETCVLRPLRRSDAGLLAMYEGDERVARGSRTIPHPLPPGATEAFIARAQDPKRTTDTWALDGSASGLPEVVGIVSLERLERDQSEITYWIAPAFWNTGLASEAVRALIAARPQGARTLFGSVFQDNPASARVLTNCGFTYLGDAETFCVARGGTVPTWTYTLKLD